MRLRIRLGIKERSVNRDRASVYFPFWSLTSFQARRQRQSSRWSSIGRIILALQVPAITSIFVCAIEENLLKQLNYRFFSLILFASQFVILSGHVRNSNRF